MDKVMHAWGNTLKERIAPFGYNSVFELYEWVQTNGLCGKRYITLSREIKDEYQIYSGRDVVNIFVSMIAEVAMKEIYQQIKKTNTMKQKINVVIHGPGINSGKLLECISEMNAGKAHFSPRDLEGYLTIQKAYMPLSSADYQLVKDGDEPTTFHISEDGGKTFTLSLEWIDLHELSEIDNEIESELQRDDLRNVNI